VGYEKATRLVSRAAAAAMAESRSFADALLGDETVRTQLGAERVAALLDPAGYLGSADLLIDRALAAHDMPLARRSR
jgi:3-carboxy-cis,cis-muconate cycloisomerase